MSWYMVHFFSLVLVLIGFRLPSAVVTGQANDESCRVTRCNHNGPTIRFPFRLKDQQPDHCGYPGFELSCSGRHKDTVLELQYGLNTSINGLHLLYYAKATVSFIDYASQWLDIKLLELDIVPLSKLLHSNSPPFVHQYYFGGGYYFGESDDDNAFFNCSSTTSQRDLRSNYYEYIIDSLSNNDFKVYAIRSSASTFDSPIISCTKMYNIITPGDLYPDFSNSKSWRLSWSVPACFSCEAKKEYCKLMDNSTSSTTCFPIPTQSITGGPGHETNKRLLAGILPSIFLIVLVFISLYYFIRSNRRKKEDQLKIKMFMEDYKALKPTRYSYNDIKKITNHFKDKLGQGGFGSVYKGQISNDIFVAVKVLNNDSRGNGEDFIREVGTIGQIHHVNVVRLVGYCADGCHRALVYEFQPNNSLEKFVYSGNFNMDNFLGWEKMQQIAQGIAKGIEYLHQGCAQQILHFDIKPHNILLDQNFSPKIADFGLAKLCSKGKSIVSMSAARGTIGYIAPEVFSGNFGNVSSKSDVYSFGMLLLDMVGGKSKPTRVDGDQNTSDVYFPEWIFRRMEQGGELVIQIEEEDDAVIAKKLTIVGLWCIGWHPIDRPSITHVIQMLQGEDCPAMPPNPFSSTSDTTTHARSFINELEVISESE